jgi:hypothetical protein
MIGGGASAAARRGISSLIRNASTIASAICATHLLITGAS